MPDEPAKFKINLQNTDLNYTAVPLNVKVNLTLYTSATNDVNFTLFVPTYLYPLENSTYSFTDGGTLFKGFNFTIVNTDLYFGEGLTLNGYIGSSIGNIIVYAKWTLYVNAELVYASPVNIIYVYE